MKDADYSRQLKAIDAGIVAGHQEIENLKEKRRRLRIQYGLELPTFADSMQDHGLRVEHDRSFDVFRVKSPEEWYLGEVTPEAWSGPHSSDEFRDTIATEILSVWNRYLAGFPPEPSAHEAKLAYYDSERQWHANQYTQEELDEVWAAGDKMRASRFDPAGQTDAEIKKVRDQWKATMNHYKIEEGDLYPARISYRHLHKIWPWVRPRRCSACDDRGYVVPLEEGAPPGTRSAFSWDAAHVCPQCNGRPQSVQTLKVVSVEHNTVHLGDGGHFVVGVDHGIAAGDSIVIGTASLDGELFEAVTAKSGVPDENGNVFSPEALQQYAEQAQALIGADLAVPPHPLEGGPVGISIGGTADVVSDEEES